MSRTHRRTKNFNSRKFVNAWFEDTEHNPFEIPNWASASLQRRLTDIRIQKSHIHSDNHRSKDLYSNFVKKLSNKIVREEKRNLIHKIKKDWFIDTPKPNNRKNDLYMSWIY